MKQRDNRNCESDTWLTAVLNRLNGTSLTVKQWLDSILLCYNLQPLDMPSFCDGCDIIMTVKHTLKCKVGGLVHIRHKDGGNKFSYLYGLVTTPRRVECKPYIYSSPGRQSAEEATPCHRSCRLSNPAILSSSHPQRACDHQPTSPSASGGAT